MKVLMIMITMLILLVGHAEGVTITEGEVSWNITYLFNKQFKYNLLLKVMIPTLFFSIYKMAPQPSYCCCFCVAEEDC